MSTVAALVDRLYRDWLVPPGEQPTRFKLSAAMAAGATSMPFDFAMLSPEEQDIVGPGQMVEVDSELFLVERVGDTDLTVRGSMFGTAAATHAVNSYVTVAPEPARITVFTAVADAVGSLWPDLWAINTTTLAGGPVIELPSDCREVVDVVTLDYGRYVHVTGWDFLSPWPQATSGRALQLWEPLGSPLTVVYRAKPATPTVESDTLASLGVAEDWANLIVVTAVANVIARADVDAKTVEFITASLAREGFPVESGTRIRNGLISYRNFLLGAAKRGLEADRPSVLQIVKDI